MRVHRRWFTTQGNGILAASVAVPASPATFTTNGLRVAGAANALFQGQDLTGCCWVQVDSTAFNDTAVSPNGRLHVLSTFNLGQAGGQSWRLVVNPNNGRFEFEGHGSSGAALAGGAASAVTVGEWQFVAFRHNAAANTLAIQVDGGTLLSTAHSLGIREPTGSDLRAGTAYNGSATQGQGCIGAGIALAGIWRSAEGGGGALSDADLLTLYNGGTPLAYEDLPAGLLTTLVAYWPMGEETGTREDVDSTFDFLQFGTVGSRPGPP